LIDTFNEYQDLIEEMPLYDDPILGLVGEVGEVVEHIKKSRRPGNRVREINPVEFAHELGDVLWYLTRVASEYDLDMSVIADMNITKLRKRHMDTEGQLGLAV
jgi:NTP pyrophosphatase (non-canonical NTP hydrolase)